MTENENAAGELPQPTDARRAFREVREKLRRISLGMLTPNAAKEARDAIAILDEAVGAVGGGVYPEGGNMKAHCEPIRDDQQPSQIHGWPTEADVLCVVCPGCAFTFSAEHTDTAPDGGYSCPACDYRSEDDPFAPEPIRELLANMAARYGWTLLNRDPTKIEPIHWTVADQIMQAVERGTV